MAAGIGLDQAPLQAAAAASAAAETILEPTIGDLLAPTGEVVARLFEHTAVIAGHPQNRRPLAECGAAFGQLLHLIDAVRDRAADADAGKFNPLERTGMAMSDTRGLAEVLLARVQDALRRAEFTDSALAEALFGKELRRAVDRVLPVSVCAHGQPENARIPRQRGSVLAPVLSVLAALLPAVFVGGGCGGGRGGGRGGCCSSGGRAPYGYYENAGYGYRRGPFGRRYPPPGYGYGYRRVGPSCGEILACNCCANLACNECCSGGNDW